MSDDLWMTSSESTYTGIIGLKESNLDTLILEVPPALSQIQRSMVWRSVPINYQHTSSQSECNSHQLVKKVILSVDILSFESRYLHLSACQQSGEGGIEKQQLSFRYNYVDQV